MYQGNGAEAAEGASAENSPPFVSAGKESGREKIFQLEPTNILNSTLPPLPSALTRQGGRSKSFFLTGRDMLNKSGKNGYCNI